MPKVGRGIDVAADIVGQERLNDIFAAKRRHLKTTS
jgi:hypothetical protein